MVNYLCILYNIAVVNFRKVIIDISAHVILNISITETLLKQNTVTGNKIKCTNFKTREFITSLITKDINLLKSDIYYN